MKKTWTMFMILTLLMGLTGSLWASPKGSHNQTGQPPADTVVQQVLQQVAPAAPQEDFETKIQRAVAAALSSQGMGGTNVASAGPEEPVFIPTGIVQDDASELDINSSTSSSGGLDEAAKALKALRKSSKK